MRAGIPALVLRASGRGRRRPGPSSPPPARTPATTASVRYAFGPVHPPPGSTKGTPPTATGLPGDGSASRLTASPLNNPVLRIMVQPHHSKRGSLAGKGRRATSATCAPFDKFTRMKAGGVDLRMTWLHAAEPAGRARRGRNFVSIRSAGVIQHLVNVGSAA